jgi:hypothetical protein
LVGKGNSQSQQQLEKYVGLLDFIQEEGAVSRLVPFRTGFANIKNGRLDPINIDTEISMDAIINNYKYGNLMDSNGQRTKVNLDYYSVRSIIGFRSPFLKTATELMRKKDTKNAILLADKYFYSLPISTDLLDQKISIKMAAIYINTSHEKGYKWVDYLLSEYQLQYNYITLLEKKGGYLSTDGNRLKQYSQQCISELTNLKNKMGKVILE